MAGPPGNVSTGPAPRETAGESAGESVSAGPAPRESARERLRRPRAVSPSLTIDFPLGILRTDVILQDKAAQ